MTPYENCLWAIERLLSATDVTYWPDSIRRDVQVWQLFRDTSHHLSTYGGMGSFNDIFICRDKGHSVTEAQEPWVNSLFDWLKSVVFYLANDPKDAVSAQELEDNVGCYDSVFVAFVGGENVRDDARGRIADRPARLEGWRCFQCHHSEATDRDLDRYIAENLLPKLVFDACEKQTLTDLVDTVIRLRIPNYETISGELKTTGSKSGITFLQRKNWTRACPSCDGNDTGMFRWILTVGNPVHFEPSEDNVPTIERITG
jgi:Domain of unknown function (DUF6966)